MILPTLTLLSAYILSAHAGCVTCPNQCSGHGTCGTNFVCDCYDNYGMGLSHDSGDCSERICPYEIAWVDTPDSSGRRHKYAECAGQGICNRESGECECFTGFEGKACARSICPNDCSGHGRCAYIENLSYGASPYDYATGTFTDDATTFSYYSWDKSKTRGCVCDPGFGDADCSKRICPYGTDIMDHRLNLLASQKYQVQRLSFVSGFNTTGSPDLYGSTFALTFKSKLNETFTTIPIYFQSSSPITLISDVKSALLALPNGVIDDLEVTGSVSDSTVILDIKFTGSYVQGPQFLLNVETSLCGDGCTPKLSGLELAPGSQVVSEVTLADYNSYECGRRGKCDYATGVCECFEGYTGPACGQVTALI